MVLVERLSNRDLTILYQRLTARDWKQAPRQRFEVAGVAPDGRREFGQINEFVTRILQGEPAGLRVREIHARVELLLSEPVSRSSVKNSLCRLSQGRSARFVRIARGRYRLLRD
jgi:hypothetical protein